MDLLVVDQNKDLCETMTEVIGEVLPGWTVDCAETIESARQFLMSKAYRVIIIDYFFVRDKLNSELSNQGAKIIILSTSNKFDKSPDYPMAKILRKPFELEEFVGVLNGK